MSGGRPSRGARVKYREVNSDDEDYDYDEFTKVVTIEPIIDDTNDEDYTPAGDAPVPDPTPKVVYPPLSPVQRQLRKVCKLGDKDLLRTFLTDNPEIELDVKDPEGDTILTEAATKAAQFNDVTEVLIKAGAGVNVADSNGNTPLHFAVHYYPSTQKTLDLLLQHGADVTAKNNDGIMPEGMAEDKDLKLILKELRKAAGRKKCTNSSVSKYLSTPDFRKKVFDKDELEESFKKVIKVTYNSPVIVNSPGLLKRKRKYDSLDDSMDERSRKRIRWNEVDSVGREIDPQFSSEEDDEVTSQEEDADQEEANDARADSEEDVVIVHNDVKKSQLLQSDTELNIVRSDVADDTNSTNETEEVQTYFYEYAPNTKLVNFESHKDTTEKEVSTAPTFQSVENAVNDNGDNLKSLGINTDSKKALNTFQFNFKIPTDNVEDADEDTKKVKNDEIESRDETDSATSNIDTKCGQAQISNSSSPSSKLLKTQLTESPDLSESVSNANEKINQDSTSDENKSFEIVKLDTTTNTKLEENKILENPNAEKSEIQSNDNNNLENISFDTPQGTNDKRDSKDTTNESDTVNHDEEQVVLKCSQGFGFFVS